VVFSALFVVFVIDCGDLMFIHDLLWHHCRHCHNTYPALYLSNFLGWWGVGIFGFDTQTGTVPQVDHTSTWWKVARSASGRVDRGGVKIEPLEPFYEYQKGVRHLGKGQSLWPSVNTALSSHVLCIGPHVRLSATTRCSFSWKLGGLTVDNYPFALTPILHKSDIHCIIILSALVVINSHPKILLSLVFMHVVSCA